MRRAGNAARLLKTAAVRQSSTVSKAVSASALQRELGTAAAAAAAHPLSRAWMVGQPQWCLSTCVVT